MSEYNGWTNYETWLVALWIDNEQPLYEDSREMARECLEIDEDPGDYSGDPSRAPIIELASRLEAWIDAGEDSPFGPMPEFGLWSDMVRAALGRVDWYEIAESFIDEVRENA